MRNPLEAAVVLLAMLPAGLVRAEEAPESQPARMQQQVHLVVFDFFCREKPEFGERLAETVRMKLRRHEEFDVVDPFTTRDASGPVPASIEIPRIGGLMREGLDVSVAMVGTVRPRGKGAEVEVRWIDLSDPADPKEWTKTFSDGTERWHAVVGREITEAVTGRPEWKPPEIGDEPVPKNFGQPVNVNGGFEEGRKGWELPDNVSTAIVQDPAGGGGVLKIRTNLARGPWLEYTRQMRFGQADPNHPPRIPTDNGEGSVAGNEGVHFRSDWIDATPGQRYWLTADVKGAGGAKIFIKGYLDWTAYADGLPETSLVQRNLTPQAFAKLPADQRKRIIAEDAKAHPELYRREVYRWYLNCGGGKNFKHRAGAVPPRGGLPANVKWIQIQCYAYWPPGEYFFDNVHLYPDPNQKAPLPEEKARTPHFDQFRQRYEK